MKKLVLFVLENCVNFGLSVCSYHVTNAFQSEFTLSNCLNVKELLAQDRCHIWSLSDCNGNRTPNQLVCKQKLNQTDQTGQIIKRCCEYLSAWCIWLYVLIMSRTRFRVNPHSIITWLSRNSLLKTGPISEL